MNELMATGEPAHLSVRDQVLQLRSQPMFEGLDDEALLLLAEQGRSATYEDGDVVAVEGEPARAVYLVVAGELVVTREGKELGVRRAGDGYGALPLLARAPSPLARARGLTRVLEIPGSAFEGALTESTSLLRNTFRVMSAALLAMRGNLPADPRMPPVVDEGTYHDRTRSMVERLLRLRQSPFGHLNLEALVDLTRHMREVRHPAGHRLWAAGELSTHTFHVDAGRVRCTTPDGASVAVGRGFTIGALDAWGARHRVYEARAETPVIGFRIDFESFFSLFEVHPEVGLEMLRGFARELNTPR